MKLIEALKIALKVKGSKHLPILNTIHISKGFVEATDLETFVRIKTDYSGPGGLIPTQALKDALKKTKAITITSDKEGAFTLAADFYKTTVKSLELEDYPNGPKLTKAADLGAFSVPTVARAYARILPHVSEDETRYILQGFCLEIHPGAKGAARLVATNGHTLGTATLRAGSEKQDPKQYVIPTTGLQFALLGKKDGELGISVGETHAHIVNGDVEVFQRVLDGTFPKWRVIVPKPGLVNFTLKGLDLANLLQSAPTGNKQSCHLTPKPEGCSVGWIDDASDGKITERGVLACATVGELARVSFHVKYLKTVAGRAKGDLLITPALNPDIRAGYFFSSILFQDAEQEAGEVTIIMPMRP